MFLPGATGGHTRILRLRQAFAKICEAKRALRLNSCMPSPIIIICADVGALAKDNKFGWWSSGNKSGNMPSALSQHTAEMLNKGKPVALGFECPLFVPLVRKECDITKSRPGEGSHPWSAGAGSTVLAIGLAQVAWVLREVHGLLKRPVPSFFDWPSFKSTRPSLFLWEAFVAGNRNAARKPLKLKPHIEDARAAVEAFQRSLPNPMGANAIVCDSDVYSLVGAALLRTGWCVDPSILEQSCLVVRAGKALHHHRGRSRLPGEPP